MNVLVETTRFILREIAEDDLQDMFDLDASGEVHQYLGNSPIKNIQEAEHIISNIQKQYLEFGIGRWAVIDKTNGAFVGWSGLKFETLPINNQNGYYDLGYRIKPQYWGKGIATETASEALKYGFEALKLKKICAAADAENVASNKVLQKVGMKFIKAFEFDSTKCNWYEMENPLDCDL